MHEIVRITQKIAPDEREEAKVSCPCRKPFEVFAQAIASPPLNHHDGTLAQAQIDIVEQKSEEHSRLEGEHWVKIVYQLRA